VAGLLVFHVIVAEVDVIPLTATALNTSGDAPVVVKVESGEVDVTPAELVEITE
jgi:hypothetical protein